MRGPRIEAAERPWLAAAIAALLLLSSVPYFAGYRMQSPDLRFSGAVFDRLDYSGYLATMEQARGGDWRYRYPFTTEPQTGAYVRMPYVALGHLAGVLGLANTTVFHAARLAIGAAALGLVYALAAQAVASVRLRRFVFLLAAAGSGVGWLQLAAGWGYEPSISPIDFWLIDAYVFFGILTFPHFAAAIACLAGMVLGFVRFAQGGPPASLAAAAAGGILLQFINPYFPLLADLAILGCAASAWRADPPADRRLFGGLAAVALSQAPAALYNLAVFRTDAVFRGFAGQAFTLSPPPVYYFFGFALFWLPAGLGIAAWRRFRPPPLVAGAAVWAVGGLALSLVPFVFQRRFLFAITVPLALIAGYGIERLLLPWLNDRAAWLHRRRGLAGQVYNLLAGVSTLYLVFGMALFVVPSRPPGLFDVAASVRVLSWLKTNAASGEAVLATADTGRVVAERTGLFVYLGHPIETLDYESKAREVERYFSGGQPEGWILEQGVEWVYWRPSDAVGSLRPPDGDPHLALVLAEAGYRLYKVLP